jgi:hypothetical protein
MDPVGTGYPHVVEHLIWVDAGIYLPFVLVCVVYLAYLEVQHAVIGIGVRVVDSKRGVVPDQLARLERTTIGRIPAGMTGQNLHEVCSSAESARDGRAGVVDAHRIMVGAQEKDGVPAIR